MEQKEVAQVEVNAYYRERTAFYDQYPEFFANLPELEYALYGTLVLDENKANEIKYATQELWAVLKKVKDYVLSLDEEEILELGYPKELVPYLYLDYLSFDTVLSRFDFVVNHEGIKAIEINNVTPFLISETFDMNNKVIENENRKIENLKIEKSKSIIWKNENRKIEIPKNENLEIKKLFSPNENCENEIIHSYVRGIVDCCHFLKIKKPKIAIVSQGVWEDWEEYVHVEYIYSIIPEYIGDIEFFNIKELTMTMGEGAYTPNGDKIDILITPAYPYEFLINDRDEEGNNIGVELLNLVRDRKLAMLNPPSSNILQSKMSFAILWNMYMNMKLTPHESEIVQRYVAPTYKDEEPFLISGETYVKKPVISREGSSVEIIRENKISKSKYDLYSEYLSVYQKFIELPKLKVILNNQFTEKYYIIGSFVCNDNAVGLSCRLGDEITEWNSHWLAVSYLREG